MLFRSFFAICALLFSLKSSAQQFARGADIGWLSEMETSGRKFYDDSGVEKDLLDILEEHCINSIRLRVWVNPANGWSGQQDVVTLAKRASAKGFRIMIDFHYSDSWADPGKQYKPAAWESYSVAQLQQAVYNHTYNVLTALKNEGVTPEWVQIGNETSDGMLWPDGRASLGATNMANYASFITNGHNAAKAVFPNIITIVHVANGFDNSLFRWNIGGVYNNGAQFDAIGMSLYPEPNNWQTLTSQCQTNMQDMVSRYNKKIVISEIGMSVSYPTEAKAFVEDIIAKNSSLNNSMGLGVFWWEPQAYNWKGYDKVAWSNNGRPTVAMDGFQTNCSATQVDCNGVVDGTAYTDNCGRCVGGNTGLEACEPVTVTFQVDMTGQNTSNGVYITGTMTQVGENWQIIPMTSLGNNIYSASFTIDPTSEGAYYFLNANDWGARETVPVACREWYDLDRGYVVGFEDLTISNTWQTCSDCSGTTDGSAFFDACDQCAGGNTGITPVTDPQKCIATGAEETPSNALKVYPNPTSGNIYITRPTSWRLINMLGEVLATGEGQEVDLGSYPAGVYLILTNETGFEVVKK